MGVVCGRAGGATVTTPPTFSTDLLPALVVVPTFSTSALPSPLPTGGLTATLPGGGLGPPLVSELVRTGVPIWALRGVVVETPAGFLTPLARHRGIPWRGLHRRTRSLDGLGLRWERARISFTPLTLPLAFASRRLGTRGVGVLARGSGHLVDTPPPPVPRLGWGVLGLGGFELSHAHFRPHLPFADVGNFLEREGGRTHLLYPHRPHETSVRPVRQFHSVHAKGTLLQKGGQAVNPLVVPLAGVGLQP